VNSGLNLQSPQNKGNFGITGFLDFFHHPRFYITLKNTTFRKPDLFPSSDEGVEDTCSVGPLGGANPNQWSTETDVVSEMLCSLVFLRMPDAGQSKKIK
jgi:hypothetical protein